MGGPEDRPGPRRANRRTKKRAFASPRPSADFHRLGPDFHRLGADCQRLGDACHHRGTASMLLDRAAPRWWPAALPGPWPPHGPPALLRRPLCTLCAAPLPAPSRHRRGDEPCASAGLALPMLGQAGRPLCRGPAARHGCRGPLERAWLPARGRGDSLHRVRASCARVWRASATPAGRPPHLPAPRRRTLLRPGRAAAAAAAASARRPLPPFTPPRLRPPCPTRPLRTRLARADAPSLLPPSARRPRGRLRWAFASLALRATATRARDGGWCAAGAPPSASLRRCAGRATLHCPRRAAPACGHEPRAAAPPLPPSSPLPRRVALCTVAHHGCSGSLERGVREGEGGWRSWPRRVRARARRDRPCSRADGGLP